jgi:hypothetical protein
LNSGARYFLLSSATAKKESVKMPFVIEAGKKTHKFFNQKLISDQEGLKSGLQLASMLRVKISDLEKTAMVESMDKLQRDISTRFNFAVDADDDLRASFRANKVSSQSYLILSANLLVIFSTNDIFFIRKLLPLFCSNAKENQWRARPTVDIVLSCSTFPTRRKSSRRSAFAPTAAVA